MTFIFPSAKIVAQNALMAHFEDRLQATSTRAPISARYYHERTNTCCVLGASIPPDIAESFDDCVDASLNGLSEANLVLVRTDLDKLRYLQRLHDKIVTARSNGYFAAGSAMALNIAEWKQRLLDYLKELAQEKANAY